jgi:hypothetical protein
MFGIQRSRAESPFIICCCDMLDRLQLSASFAALPSCTRQSSTKSRSPSICSKIVCSREPSDEAGDTFRDFRGHHQLHYRLTAFGIWVLCHQAWCHKSSLSASSISICVPSCPLKDNFSTLVVILYISSFEI